MPSTRGGGRVDYSDGLPNDYSDDSDDPDYREDSAEEDHVDDIPKNMQRDRAQWIVDNVEDLEWLYNELLANGRSVMGRSFMQTGNMNNFANFVYRFTTPFSES